MCSIKNAYLNKQYTSSKGDTIPHIEIVVTVSKRVVGYIIVWYFLHLYEYTLMVFISVVVFMVYIVSADSGLVSVLINHIMVIAFIARVDHMGSHFIIPTSHLIT